MSSPSSYECKSFEFECKSFEEFRSCVVRGLLTPKIYVGWNVRISIYLLSGDHYSLCLLANLAYSSSVSSGDPFSRK